MECVKHQYKNEELYWELKGINIKIVVKSETKKKSRGIKDINGFTIIDSRADQQNKVAE